MQLAFSGDAWDTEERILDQFRTYVVELTIRNRNGQLPMQTMDVWFVGTEYDDEDNTLYLLYKPFSEELDAKHGGYPEAGAVKTERIEYDLVHTLTVY